MKFLVFLVTFEICCQYLIRCEVIFTKNNILAKPDPVGLGFVKFIFDKKLTFDFDSKKFFDSDVTRAIRSYIRAKNSSLSNLNLTSQCEGSLTALLNNFDLVFNYNGTINVNHPEFWSLKGSHILSIKSLLAKY